MRIRCRIALALAGVLAAIGCQNSNSQGTSTTQTGVFVDSAVEGLRYEGPHHSGMTNAAGEYDFEPGDQVCFFIGDIPLGCAVGRGVVAPMDLFGGTSMYDPVVTNVVRFLISLDADGDPNNGIDVSQILTSLEDANLDFEQPGFAFESDSAILAFITAHGHDGNLADSGDAEDHLSQSLSDHHYYEQILLSKWIIIVNQEDHILEIEMPTFTESDIETRSMEANDEEVFFDYTLGGELCTFEGEYEQTDGDSPIQSYQIYGSVYCPSNEPRVATGTGGKAQAIGFGPSDFTAYSVSERSEFEASDLDNGWYGTIDIDSPSDFRTSFTLPFFDASAIEAAGAILSADGAVHFVWNINDESPNGLALSALQNNPPAGGACTFDGQMESSKSFMAGTVNCQTFGTGFFAAEID